MLTKHKVVRSKYLTKGSRTNRIHRARLQVHQDGPGNILPT